MKKEEVLSIIEDEQFNNKIQLDDIPEIDLYMDQVIQLFEGKLSGTKRNAEDKLLTKTMINNYAKAKLLMSIKNKKYTKEHLILMSLIYELKGVISINDIKCLVNNIVDKFEKNEEYNLRDLYSKYLDTTNKDNEIINKIIEEKINNINEDSFEDQFILISSIISMSNLLKRVGEVLIDNCFRKEEE